MFVLDQFELFGMYGTATTEELAANIRLGKQMTRKHLSSLCLLYTSGNFNVLIWN